jgi:hypothetical protein
MRAYGSAVRRFAALDRRGAKAPLYLKSNDLRSNDLRSNDLRSNDLRSND